MTFGEKIQTLRKQAGMSQESLAEKLGITRQTVSKWELDQSTPELGYIAKLADLYNVSADYLIRDEAEFQEIKNPSESKDVNGNTVETKQDTSAPIIALGIVLSVIGLIGILTFIVLSVVYPWTYGNDFGTFEGLAGFLLGSKTVAYFLLSVVLLILGMGILVSLSLKKNLDCAEKLTSRSSLFYGKYIKAPSDRSHLQI